MELELTILAQRLGVALGLGLLVGGQRERSGTEIAGLRTFALTALLGATTAAVSSELGSWLVVAGLVGTMVMVVVGNLALEPPQSGMTTEAALLLVYMVGVLAGLGWLVPAILVGAACGLLLYLKGPLHALTRELTEKDSRAIWQFVVLTLVVLPLLPDREMGPYEVLNPRNVWWMVVLIVSVSLVGYLLYRLRGARSGLLVGGLIGGLISSTATTMSVSKRVRDEPKAAGVAAVALGLAFSVSIVRMLVELAVVASDHLLVMARHVGVLLLAMLVVCAWLYRRHARGDIEIEEPSNPTELASALGFGALYAVVLLGIAAARDAFGATGLYTVATLAGFTDVDAVTLSTARLVGQGELEATVGSKLLLTAALSNLIFKIGLAVAVAGRGMMRSLGLAMLPAVATAVALFFW